MGGWRAETERVVYDAYANKTRWNTYMLADRDTTTFDYGVAAELFMAKFRPCAGWAPGCRSVTNASMATTFNAFTRATITHCNGVCRIDRQRDGLTSKRQPGRPASR